MGDLLLNMINFEANGNQIVLPAQNRDVVAFCQGGDNRSLTIFCRS